MTPLIIIAILFILPVIFLLVSWQSAKNYRELHSSEGKKLFSLTDKARVMVLDSVVHELGNCACTLLSMFENIQHSLQQQGLLESKHNQDFELIYQQINRIIEAKLDASIFSQLVEDNSEYVNVNECIRSCWRVLRFEKRTSGIDIQMKLADNVSVINMSSASLMSVLTNLLTNSLDALENISNIKKISISTFNFNNYTVIRVIDSGCGISKENLSKIKMAHFTTKEKGKGTGMGMYIINQIVTNLKGKFEIESQEGVGTTVSLYFSLTNVLR